MKARKEIYKFPSVMDLKYGSFLFIKVFSESETINLEIEQNTQFKIFSTMN